MRNFEREEITRLLDDYQEQRSGFFNLKQVEPGDILYTEVKENLFDAENKIDELSAYHELFDSAPIYTTIPEVADNVKETSARNTCSSFECDDEQVDAQETINTQETIPAQSNDLSEQIKKILIEQNMVSANSKLDDETVAQLTSRVIEQLNSQSETDSTTAKKQDVNANKQTTNTQTNTKASSDARKDSAPAQITQKRFLVAGCFHRVGTTHFALSLAFALKGAHTPQKVCVVIPDKVAFEKITTGFEEINNILNFKGVDFFCKSATDAPKNYHYCVVDTGLIYPRDRSSAFMKTDQKNTRRYLVAGGNPWDIEQIIEMAKTPELREKITWCFFGMSSLAKKVFDSFTVGAKVRTFDIPYDNLLFDEESNAPNKYNSLFRNPQSKKRKNKGGK